MKTYLKWAGSKFPIMNQLSPFFPETIEGTFYDPFCGSLSVLFFLKERQPNLNAVCSDANPDLINCHIQVRDHLDKLIPTLELLERMYNQSLTPESKSLMYYGIRDNFNAHINSALQQAAFMIFLNRTCFKGLWRVNQMKGEFNVPHNNFPEIKLYNIEVMRACSEALQGVTLLVLPYHKFLLQEQFTERDFIYIDPPYVAPANGTTFRGYTQKPFTKKDDKHLEKNLVTLNQNYRTPIVASNSIDAKELYTAWSIHTLMRSGAMNSKIQKRPSVSEIVAVLA